MANLFGILTRSPMLHQFQQPRHFSMNWYLSISIWTFSKLRCIFTKINWLPTSATAFHSLFTFLVLFSKRQINWPLFHISKMPINVNVTMIFFSRLTIKIIDNSERGHNHHLKKSNRIFFGKKWFYYLAIHAPCTGYLAEDSRQ